MSTFDGVIRNFLMAVFVEQPHDCGKDNQCERQYVDTEPGCKRTGVCVCHVIVRLFYKVLILKGICFSGILRQ